MAVNTKLKARIVELFGSQADFAQALGCHESRISQIVRGRRKLTPDQIKDWKKALKCDDEFLADAV